MKSKYYTCKLTKERIDEYLFEMAKLFTQLGADSSNEEYEEAYRKENEYIDLIALLDESKAKSLRPYGT